MRRDTAPTRRLTLVYPLPQRLLITLSPPPAIRQGAFSSPLLPLTSPFTVKVHANVSFIAPTRAGCQRRKERRAGEGTRQRPTSPYATCGGSGSSCLTK